MASIKATLALAAQLAEKGLIPGKSINLQIRIDSESY